MTTTTYLWDTLSDNLLLEDDGTAVTKYTNEPDQFGDLISQRNDINTNFYHFDARGDTRELTQNTEVVTDTYLYDAWGNVLSSTGTAAPRFQFTGQRGYFVDPTTGQDYIRNRWYARGEARWLSPDLLGFVDGVNKYSYVQNSPIVAVDPSGTQSLDPSGSSTVASAKWTLSMTGQDLGVCGKVDNKLEFEYTIAEPKPHNPFQQVLQTNESTAWYMNDKCEWQNFTFKIVDSWTASQYRDRNGNWKIPDTQQFKLPDKFQDDFCLFKLETKIRIGFGGRLVLNTTSGLPWESLPASYKKAFNNMKEPILEFTLFEWTFNKAGCGCCFDPLTPFLSDCADSATTDPWTEAPAVGI